MPIPASVATGRARLAGIKATSPRPSARFWRDMSWDSRDSLVSTNNTGVMLHDHVVSATVPAEADVNSLRVVEVESDGTAHSHASLRYATSIQSVNRTHFLIHYRTGNTIYFKVPGRWANGETRRFHVYWNRAGGISAISTWNHLGGNVQGWTVALTAGATNDHYILVVGGQTYDYQMTAGQTAAQIGTAIAALINAGTVATATGTTTLTIKQTDYTNTGFSVANTGSTDPSKLVVTKPIIYGLGRKGPDNETYNAGGVVAAGLPFKPDGISASTRPGFGLNNHRLFRFGSWSLNVGGSKNMNDALVTSVVDRGPWIDVAGTVSGTSGEWTASYTAQYKNKIFSGRKSNVYPDNGDVSLSKYVDVIRAQIVYTCQSSYTPTAIVASGGGFSVHELFSLTDLDNVFSSNVTEVGAATPQTSGAQTQNAVPSFYADKATGSITAHTVNTDLSALTPENYIFGAHGNVNGMVMALTGPVQLAGFGTQAPTVKIGVQGNGWLAIQLRNIINTAVIPAGATVTFEVLMVHGTTPFASSVGDNLLPDEAVRLAMGELATPPVVTTSAVIERYSSVVPLVSVKQAATKLKNGVKWFMDNALGNTGTSWAYGYGWDLTNATAYMADDEDATYGVGYMLAGMCLQYARTDDISLVPLIESLAQYFLTLESTVITQAEARSPGNGAWWTGSTPYFVWMKATPSIGYTAEGVAGNDVWPGMPGGVSGTINYAQGEIRLACSIDQLHMVALGLYHYMYVLRNKPAITANTTLRANILSFLGRMATFEAAHYASQAKVCGNVSQIANGVATTFNNGITTTYSNVASSTVYTGSPFRGSKWYPWEVSNTDTNPIDPASNLVLDDTFRGIYAPGTTLAGLQKYIKGMAHDMLLADCSHHEYQVSSATWGTPAPLGFLPKGWQLVGSSFGVKYVAGRSGDKHYLDIAGSRRDLFVGRTFQRLEAIAFAALFDPTIVVDVELDGSGVTQRSVPILTAMDQLINACTSYLIEPTTGAARYGFGGVTGGTYGGGVHEGTTPAPAPKIIQAPFTGYGLFAMELAMLVKSGVSYATHYSPNGVF